MIRWWLRCLVMWLAGLALTACEPARPQLGSFTYPASSLAIRCALGTRAGAAGLTDHEESARKVKFSVRTPANYDPTVAHPLLMVFAPGGQTRFESEAFSGLTPAATAAGFVVAYADSGQMRVPMIEELGTIPVLVSRKWCIDSSRIVLTGHSDGGTVALALSILPKTAGLPAAIAPSAAGFTGKDLADHSCRAPLPVMVMHSSDDTLFPGYGVQAARWWAGCNRCSAGRSHPLQNGCSAYEDCSAPTLYCQGTGAHTRWPGLNDLMLAFFADPNALRQQDRPATPQQSSQGADRHEQ